MAFYVNKAIEQIGPVPLALIDGLVTDGQIQDDTLVWLEGSPNWEVYKDSTLRQIVLLGGTATASAVETAIGGTREVEQKDLHIPEGSKPTLSQTLIDQGWSVHIADSGHEVSAGAITYTVQTQLYIIIILNVAMTEPAASHNSYTAQEHVHIFV